ncbi:MAG: DNA repair protein RecN [Halieaceae bacterium]|jgi:DNA repair protein RecN (Recombination protein N)|nr:DNA repair protein RecN [Halieaceae bacterium]
MLKHLAIFHYAIVDRLELDLRGGMTVITGETGAGKSIMLDALGLCLGDRADSKAVQPGANRAEISAEFDVSALPAAQAWLKQRELDSDDVCILRRTIGADGRSRAFINGSPSPLTDCAELGALLVDIHSQHAHQSLLRSAVQRTLLDAYSSTEKLAHEVYEAALRWRSLSETYAQLSNQDENDRARRDLLAYQVEELEQLAVGEDEVARLEAEQKTLSNASFIIESASRMAAACEQQSEQLRSLRSDIADERHSEKAMRNARELFASVEIQLEEARSELSHYADSVDLDPHRLGEIEQRLSTIYDLARKHRVQPEQLPTHLLTLQQELEALEGGDAKLEALAQEISAAQTAWEKAAAKLTKLRVKGAKKLAARTMDLLAQLAMERCTLEIALQPNEAGTPEPHGAEKVAYLISTNPGAEPGPLAKVASGGELSRISLALQVAAAEVATSPTMVFDEVDVGIGGGVAEIVGSLLRELASRVQVICVTHLPQVAAKGQHHLQVQKTGDKTRVVAGLSQLDHDARIEEVARMLGGVKITENTRSHAREMLESA